ncbi:winged helix-turn-helix domain-containing protein [Sphingomonas sp.]|uniref:winged helix-turn-helix domain-containing protein n=1 Tax=Sphingomonas sp. TaxID=28214 RepID=UPI001B1CABC0|nr:winged helix-turn-helix domain-containing protein [Sphingomonas sp.]MBO9713663.1 winged helix-turn-helix domain-containing protein [Sphingomonas sp.]
MTAPGRIELAHVAPFPLGALSVRPETRELTSADGATEILEPRVMQVLVALAQARGSVVTRDELGQSCWDGRVVGEDAINRVLSRLRRVAEGIGQGRFRIETITKVGYRLVLERAEPAPAPESAPGPAHPSRRRLLLLGGGAAAVAAAGGGAALFLRRPAQPKLPPEAEALMARARDALRLQTTEANMTAIGLMRRVVELAPDNAEAWALLAEAYAWAYFGRGMRDDASMMTHAKAALDRARALDPRNTTALKAEFLLMPGLGSWGERERKVKAALVDHPDDFDLVQSLGWVYAQTGQCNAALGPFRKLAAIDPTAPSPRYQLATTLWAANRLEEADRVVDESLSLFPGYYAMWFARFYLSLYSGRVNDAIAFAENIAIRPPGIPPAEFELILKVARAMRSRNPAEVDSAMAAALESAHHGSGHAENAIAYACAFGRIDTAFEIADALFFARGFDPGEVRFTTEQGSFTRRDDRRTHYLFWPPYAPLRADPRFERLMEAIGLAKFWRDNHIVPDYRR